MREEFYLDNVATTPVHPEVIKVIMDTMTNIYGNPSSLHSIGIIAKSVVNTARKTIAQYINCKPNEIIFTSGACEANSLAIAGWKKVHYHGCGIVSAIEHKSVLKAFDGEFNKDEMYILPVDSNGLANLDLLEAVCKDYDNNNLDGFIVSVQAANSEIGTIQKIRQIADIVHKYHGVYHCDATQLFADRQIDVKTMGVDMLSMSGQKINTPKGIGFLYVKTDVELSPIIYGSQEKGLRGGTENVPYIAGLGKAIELLDKKLSNQDTVQMIANKTEYFATQLLKHISDCRVNGVQSLERDSRLTNNINVSFKGVEAESLLLLLNQCNIYVSSGSACNAGDTEPSIVLKEIGVPKDYIRGTIRLTISDDFTKEEIDYVVEKIADYVKRLRDLNGDTDG